MFSEDPFDYFFSYSRDIYDAVAEEIITRLEYYGIKLWVDKTDVILGSNIYDLLDEVLSRVERSEGAIVLIDQSFFAKEWCLMELKYFIDNNITFLPILYGIDKANIPDEFSFLRQLNLATINSNEDIPMAINKVLDSMLSRIKITKTEFKLKSDILEVLIKDYLGEEGNSVMAIIKADNIALCMKKLLELSKYKFIRDDYFLFTLIHNKTSSIYQKSLIDRHDVKLVKLSVNKLLYKFNSYLGYEI
ncbi:toll/interleukin-1 receptor domain-containing protein [Ulvibacterium sp.]|uniref:toll/interleukin-1 receptor domain-containing protein n=1 Tax=Ulvibacterium sp. TaxID=2665914 RepID=UPI003BA8589E